MTRGSVVVAVGGAAAAVPGLTSILHSAPAKAAASNDALSVAEGGADLDGPLVAHVDDIKTGAIRVYQGQTQVTLKDPSIAARLYRATSKEGK